MKRTWIILLTTLVSVDALAQTGPVATVPDNSGIIPVFAVIAMIGAAVLIAALFEPWNWFKRKR